MVWVTLYSQRYQSMKPMIGNVINKSISIDKQDLQNRAARIVARTVRSNPAMDFLKWPTLEERRRKSVFKLVKKCLQGQCPQYFKEYFKRNNTIHARATRQSNLLHPPAVRTEIAKRSFYYYGCILFNELS